MRPFVEENVVYVGQLFIISATWKSDYDSVVRSTTPEYWLYVINVILQVPLEPRKMAYIELQLNN